MYPSFAKESGGSPSPGEFRPVSAGGAPADPAASPPAPSGQPSDATGTPPGQLVDAVRRVFAEVLGLGTVAADDDFFLLGGNSVLATRLTELTAAATGVRVHPRAFYRDPTPLGVARAVEPQRGPDDPAPPAGSPAGPPPGPSAGSSLPPPEQTAGRPG